MVPLIVVSMENARYADAGNDTVVERRIDAWRAFPSLADDREPQPLLYRKAPREQISDRALRVILREKSQASNLDAEERYLLLGHHAGRHEKGPVAAEREHRVASAQVLDSPHGAGRRQARRLPRARSTATVPGRSSSTPFTTSRISFFLAFATSPSLEIFIDFLHDPFSRADRRLERPPPPALLRTCRSPQAAPPLPVRHETIRQPDRHDARSRRPIREKPENRVSESSGTRVLLEREDNRRILPRKGHQEIGIKRLDELRVDHRCRNAKNAKEVPMRRAPSPPSIPRRPSPRRRPGAAPLPFRSARHPVARGCPAAAVPRGKRIAIGPAS